MSVYGNGVSFSSRSGVAGGDREMVEKIELTISFVSWMIFVMGMNLAVSINTK